MHPFPPIPSVALPALCLSAPPRRPSRGFRRSVLHSRVLSCPAAVVGLVVLLPLSCCRRVLCALVRGVGVESGDVEIETEKEVACWRDFDVT